MLYINGKPYVVRESTRPFANLEYTGASLPLAVGTPLVQSYAHDVLYRPVPTWSTLARLCPSLLAHLLSSHMPMTYFTDL